MVAQNLSPHPPTSSPSPSVPTFLPLLGHCDVGPIADHTHLSLVELNPIYTPPPSVSPSPHQSPSPHPHSPDLVINPKTPTASLDSASHPLLPSTTTLEVLSMYVHPSAQGTGVAQKLFASSVRHALKLFPGCREKLIVITVQVNHPAQRFYHKLGGRMTGIYSNYPVHNKMFNVVCFEWIDVEKWVRKWEAEFAI